MTDPDSGNERKIIITLGNGEFHVETRGQEDAPWQILIESALGVLEHNGYYKSKKLEHPTSVVTLAAHPHR